jgi:hypothetical protein
MRMLSFERLRALLRKEWIQVRRDPITLRFIIAVPMMQLFLFGYAINTNPKQLPTGLLSKEHSKYERTLVAALQNTGYYDVRTLSSEQEGERGLAQGELLFVIDLPANFDRLVDQGRRPRSSSTRMPPIHPRSATRRRRSRPWRRRSTATYRPFARPRRLRHPSNSSCTRATTPSS